MPDLKKPCYFCENTQFQETKEHFMKKSLGPRIPHEPILVRKQSTPEGFRSWTINKSPFLAQTVSNICAVCNNGWMNDLDVSFELDLAGLAAGEQRQYNVEQRRQLVRWATKYAACHELQMQSLPYFSQEARNRIRLDSDGDDSAYLWMAHTPVHKKVFDRMLTMTGESRDRTRAMISTLAYGQIAFVLLRHDGSYVGRQIQSDMQHISVIAGLTHVWPFHYGYSFSCPAQGSVDHADIWLMSSGGHRGALHPPADQERAGK